MKRDLPLQPDSPYMIQKRDSIEETLRDSIGSDMEDENVTRLADYCPYKFSNFRAEKINGKYPEFIPTVADLMWEVISSNRELSHTFVMQVLCAAANGDVSEVQDEAKVFLAKLGALWARDTVDDNLRFYGLEPDGEGE